MSDSNRKFDISVGASYSGSGAMKLATADLQKLREQANLPIMGPLNKDQSATEAIAIDKERISRVVSARAKAMAEAGERSRINEIAKEQLFGKPEGEEKFPDLSGTVGSGNGFGSKFGVHVFNKRIGEASEGFYHSLKEQSEGLEHFGKIIRGVGAVGVFTEFGRKMAELPDTIDKFHEDIKSGMTKTEAMATAFADLVPVIGDLAKGFRGFRSFLHDLNHPQENEDRWKREEEQDRRDKRQVLADQNISRREPILISGRDVARDAGARLNLEGVRGTAREAVEIENKYIEADRKLQDLWDKRGVLTTEQQDALKAQITGGRKANRIDRDFEMEEFNKRTNEAIEANRREHVDKLISIDDEASNLRLENQGKFFEESLQKTLQEEMKELEAIRRVREDESKNPNVDQVKSEEAYQKGIIAIRKRGTQQRTNLQDTENLQRDDADRDHKASLLDAESEFAERRLRLAGNTIDADRLQIKQAYDDRLSAIQKDEAAQLRVKNADSDAIKKRATEDAAVAKEAFRLSNDELEERKRQEFRVPRPTGISGETGVLTGATGAGANAGIQEMVGANERTARAAEAQQKATEDLSDKIDDLIKAITTGAITIVRDK